MTFKYIWQIYKDSNLHTYERILYFLHNIFSRCLTINIQLSIMSKWLAKHISNKVSFKFTIRKRRVYIDIGWPWIWNQYFYLGVWKDDRTNIIVFPSFQLVTRMNSQYRNENVFINVFWLITLYMNIGISKWHNWSFDLT